MSYRRYGRGSRYGRRNYGREAALQHISEAHSFSHSIGGTDRDVKQYFFSLSGQELERIFFAYGKAYGDQAEAYARKIFYDWKSGSRQMSGKVAERLFNLLPPVMPLSKKLELAGKIWDYYNPKSLHHFTVGPLTDIEVIMTAVRDRVESAIQSHNVPDQLRNRFEWLSGGDVQVKEQLLNHFREEERKLALITLNEQMPILQRQMRENTQQTISLRTKMSVHRHEFEVWIDRRLRDGFHEGPPRYRDSSESGWGCLIISVLALLLYLFIQYHSTLSGFRW
jgi:hypothetical protein